MIQDTSCISYMGHEKIRGLAVVSKKQSKGIMMHTAFAISTEGLTLGILDQKLYSRPSISKEDQELEKRRRCRNISIEDKESIKWLESLKKTNEIIDSTQTETITVCDREADIYDFFELAYRLNSAVLIRACRNRNVNKTSRYSREEKLWQFI
ncbi:hypothetical protein wNi1_10970 [Wolbachia pipientis]